MKVNTKSWAIALCEAIKESKGEQQKKVLQNFVALLAKNNILSLTDKILVDFVKYYNQVEGIVEVQAKTAHELSTSEADKIISQLKSILGKQVELKKTVDAKLIGGVKLRIEDIEIDGSIQTQLENLRYQILSSN